MPPVLVREMQPSERSMVLSDWKRSLWDAHPSWGRALLSDEWWALVNFVIDRLTFQKCKVWVVCHLKEPSVPLGWVATREGVTLHSHARAAVRDEPELAAYLERTLLEHAQSRPGTFNPFQELKRP